ncbi:AAA family ATPase [Burkholderia ambifaria]|uniref:AAA family ATPase n=1 Tax=Burkholderia ambifaria TaxID=152480 RepID=UPI00158859F3|nr:AAA family ATPase [Burkholderia ambifaria]QQJ96406.1 AAA family ATPase [Burkholderia ambifaria]
MFIRAIEIRINSNGESFGFRCRLEPGLNIIKGRNSSGKSTLVNTLLYGLGLEELVGAKGERVLTSAVRDSFQYDGASRRIDESAVLVELQNAAGQIVTFRRPIRNSDKATKLVEAFECPLITQQPAPNNEAIPLFVHDAGSALYEQGFLRYFETFLGMKLPRVQSSTGGLTRLYPQVVAAALFIEQKRGWTDYIANIPFYQILGAPTRVVQYLLGLDNFKLEEEKALNEQLINRLQTSWTDNVADLHAAIRTAGVTVRGVPKALHVSFEPQHTSLWVKVEGEDVPVPSAVSTKTTQWHAIEDRRKQGPVSASPDVIELIDVETTKLDVLMVRYEALSSESRLRTSSLSEFRELLQEAESDLRKYKTTRKLHELGASMQLAIAEGHCPTCGSEVENTLVPHTDGVAPMDLQSNIDYLEAQIRMLKRQILGLENSLSESMGSLSTLSREANEQRSYVLNLRKNVSQSDATLEADIRRQISLENDIRVLQAAQSRLVKFLEQAGALVTQLADALATQKKFPSDLYSKADHIKISLFEKNFRANAQSFGYTSAEIDEVRINTGTLLPALGDITLRAVLQKNVKSESSASDFVRLIWAFLLAIYQTSSSRDYPGNHPGVLFFDEPGQHSMSEHSQKALVNMLSGSRQLQSVLAASFDESAQLFEEVTEGSRFHLVELPEKIIGPLDHNGMM